MSCAQLVVGFYLATGLGPWSSARLAGLGDTKMESLMEAGFGLEETLELIEVPK